VLHSGSGEEEILQRNPRRTAGKGKSGKGCPRSRGGMDIF